MLKQIAKMLVEVAMNKGLITYGDISRKLNKAINPRNLDNPLGELSLLAQDNGYPKISAIVVNQESGMPGAGFFNYFYGGISRDQWDRVWIKEINEIYEFDNWPSFLNLL